MLSFRIQQLTTTQRVSRRLIRTSIAALFARRKVTTAKLHTRSFYVCYVFVLPLKACNTADGRNEGFELGLIETSSVRYIGRGPKNRKRAMERRQLTVNDRGIPDPQLGLGL